LFTLALGTATTGFEGEFRFMADLQGLGTAVGRHPSANLLPIFNDSYRQMRDQVTEWGYTQFLNRGTTTAMPTSAVEAGETYAVISVGTAGTPGTPGTVLQIKAVDAKLSNGRWRRLDEVTFLQTRDHFIEPNRRGFPEEWCWLSGGVTSGANLSVAGQIAIWPIPNGGSYVLWSMQEFTALSATSDVYAYHNADWKQWHMMTAMQRVCAIRDKDMAKKMQAIDFQLNPGNEGTVAERMKSQAPTAAGPKTWTRSQSYNGRGPWGG
jgi:hypothetical protein